MFDIGIQELIVIFLVALLVFGPKRLPELGRSLGKGMAELKKAMQGVKEQMDSELHEIEHSPSQKSDESSVTNNELNNDSKLKTQDSKPDEG